MGEGVVGLWVPCPLCHRLEKREAGSLTMFVPCCARQVLGPRAPLWVGKCSQRWYSSCWLGEGVPEPVKRLGWWSSLALRHPGTARSLRRAENGLWARGLGQAQGRDRGAPLLDGCRRGLGSCDWKCREAFYRRLDSGSVGKGLLHASHGKSG